MFNWKDIIDDEIRSRESEITEMADSIIRRYVHEFISDNLEDMISELISTTAMDERIGDAIEEMLSDIDMPF